MLQKDYLQNIPSKYILKIIFSHLEPNIFYKLIKFHKNTQNRLNIDWKNSVLKYNYDYIVKTKNEIMENIEKMKDNPKFSHISDLSYSSKFFLKYHYHLTENINDEDKETLFLIRYKGFKINDYPLPSNFISLNHTEIMNFLKKCECYFEYSLNDKNIELINSINKIREKNNINLLIYNKLQNLETFFKERKRKNENYTFVYTKDEFQNKIFKNEEHIIKILLNKEFRYIIILEREDKEYIFLYSCKDKDVSPKIDNKKNNSENFHLINNKEAKIKMDDSYESLKTLKSKMKKFGTNCDCGYQLLSLIDDILIGVLEGPPDTPYENGYFLFKILFPNDLPMVPIKFCFITPIFHPNISEVGYVCVDIFNERWSPVIWPIPALVISAQSLLDDPNPDDFINEFAANLYKKDKNIYNETVRMHTSQFASYPKFLEAVGKLNIDFEI